MRQMASLPRKSISHACYRLIVAILGSVLLLAGCTSGDENVEPGQVGYVVGFYGGVAADEPYAALVGRDTLTAGGSAADAAVAMYFTMAATMPSSASLGGGGACIAHNRKSSKTEALLFLPEAAPGGGVVPGNVRGMFALHARYGVLRWAQLVAPGERAARLGVTVSRAFSRELTAAGSDLTLDPEASRIFGRGGSGVLREGDRFEQLELAAVLGIIRSKGAGELYVGPLGRRFAEATEAQGAPVSVEALRAFKPRWVETASVPVGNHNLHFLPEPVTGSVNAQRIFTGLADDGRFDSDDPQQVALALADAAQRAVTRSGLGGSGSAGFIVADRIAGAVACSFTTNAQFGARKVLPELGILMAAPPAADGSSWDGLAADMMTNANTGDFLFAAHASGGASSAAALGEASGRAILRDEDVQAALDGPRVMAAGGGFVVEPEGDLAGALRQRGMPVMASQRIGSVLMLHCPVGIWEDDSTCRIDTDRRGAGLAGTLEQ